MASRRGERTWSRWLRIVLGGALLVAPVAAADFFSPGELARPHADLEGLSQCTRCHEAGEKLSQDKCLSCHQELKPEIKAKTGLHGRIPAGDRDCESCHKEHQGRKAELINWGPGHRGGFDHGKLTGWALEGRHASTTCESCHQTARVSEKATKARFERMIGKVTFLGLQTACAACHFDEHRGQLGSACADCHNAKGWSPAPGFDHNDETDFPLRGAHKRVACEGCHAAAAAPPVSKGAFPAPKNTASFMKFEDAPHAACVDCHADPHQGRFGERCQSCHSEVAWNRVHEAAKDRSFHEKTRFPLKGAHLEAPCQGCHGPFPGHRAKFKGLSFSRCEACHLDAHPGQLGKAATRPPCSRCHTEDGFTPAHFGIEEHQKTRYPLAGAHIAVACIGCHRPDPALANLIPAAARQQLIRSHRPVKISLMVFDLPPKTSERCTGCHVDPHGGQFVGRTCETCHGLESFHALKFSHDRDSRFALTGKHAQAPCGGCHSPEGPQQRIRYRPLPMECSACHEDAHAGQFAPVPRRPTACERCHATEAFDAGRFRHEPPFTTYLLEGKHAKTPCAGCHPTVDVGPGLKVRKFRGVPRACEGCHEDAHHGQFRGLIP